MQLARSRRLIASIILLVTADTGQAQTPKERAVRLATDTLAAQLAIPAAELHLVNVANAEWRDSSLGCPEPEKVYTPALQNGFKVVLRTADTKQYEVHTAGGRAVVCGGAAQAVQGKMRETVRPALAAAAAARKHLATQLKIAPSDVIIRLVRPWRPQDDGPCDRRDAQPTPDVTYYVDLGRDGQTYRYRATTDAAWPCPESAAAPK
jgi:hypothetical protein